MITKEQARLKPLQRVSWNDKVANDGEWFEINAEHYLAKCSFSSPGNNTANSKANMYMLYKAYNNELPKEWFANVVNPLKSTNPKYQQWPAKIRPTTILRTNLDLLLGEWPRRPFKYRVENIGEDGYNSFLDNLNKMVEKNVTDIFMAIAQQEMQAQGATEEQLSQITPDQLPTPDEVKRKFQVSYKDKIAIKANKWFKRALIEYNIKKKIHTMFKDWLIVGDAASYKAIHNGELVYERVGPPDIECDPSPDNPYYEDSEWVVRRKYMNYSEIVDWFYDILSDEDLKKIENQRNTRGPQAFFSYLSGLGLESHTDVMPVYHIVWKGKKKVIELTYMDETTGKMQTINLDESENYKPKDDESIKELWVNEYYETWKLTDDLYTKKQAIPAQRNEMNNISICKGPYNGRKFSDTYADNISVLQIGIPFQIMYIIVTRALELTMARSKGKITLLDKNIIPKKDGWDEEKFIYYAEALGWGLMDRSQLGVDKSFNQYQVLDMTLMKEITDLINLQNHIKKQWDDVLGISDQRKAQTAASETLGATQEAIFRSTVITDMIFLGFEEFVEKELQGILDLSKYVNIDGVKRLYNSDAMADELFEIDPESYAYAQLGLFMTQNPEDYQALEEMKAESGNMIQNGVKPSTILEIKTAGNVAELKSILKQIEAIQAEQEQASAKNQQDAEAMADERKKTFMEYEKMLEEQLINAEYDRKEDLEYAKGEVSLLTAGISTDANSNGVPDVNEVAKNELEREKIAADDRRQQRELLAKERETKFNAYVTEREGQRKERIENKKVEATKIKARMTKKTK